MDSDELQLHVLLSVLREKILDFYLGSKMFCPRTQLLAKLQGQRLSDFLRLTTV